jgi:hypothetical protein
MANAASMPIHLSPACHTAATTAPSPYRESEVKTASSGRGLDAGGARS